MSWAIHHRVKRVIQPHKVRHGDRLAERQIDLLPETFTINIFRCGALMKGSLCTRADCDSCWVPVVAFKINTSVDYLSDSMAKGI